MAKKVKCSKASENCERCEHAEPHLPQQNCRDFYCHVAGADVICNTIYEEKDPHLEALRKRALRAQRK